MVVSRMDWASMMHRHVCVCERESQTGAFSAFCCVIRTFVDDMQVAFVDQCRHNIAIVDSISVSVMHLQLSISMSATSINKYNVDKWFWTQNWVHNLSINVGTTLHLSIRSVCHWCNLHFINLSVGNTSIKKYVMWHHRHWWSLKFESAIAPRTTRTYTEHTPDNAQCRK